MNFGFYERCFKSLRPIAQEEGQDLVEYGLILSLISVGSITIMGNLGITVADYYRYIVAHLF